MPAQYFGRNAKAMVSGVVPQTTIADIDTGTVNSGDSATDTVIEDLRTKFDTLKDELEALGLLA